MILKYKNQTVTLWFIIGEFNDRTIKITKSVSDK